MKQFQYTIKDELGVHARPAGLLVKLAKQYTSAITIEKNGKTCDMRKLMAVMGMGIRQGETITVSCDGEGEAEAIMKVQTALADSIKLLNSANPNDQVVKLKALESFEKAADGQATKIIVPSEIQSLAGLAASFKGLLEDEKK